MATIEVTQVQTSTGPQPREKQTSSPAFESENSRYYQVGPLRQDNPAASQANTLMTLMGVDAVAPTGLQVGRAGTITGVMARSNAAITAGAVTFRPAVNGVVQGAVATGEAVVIDSTVTTMRRVVNFANPISFAAGDLIGLMLSTNGAYLPITADHYGHLLVRWAA